MSDLNRAAEIERLLQLLLHDLRSPLGVAQGYVSLLAGQALSPADRERAMRGVADAIARMTVLVDDVATFLTPDDADVPGRLVEAGVLCERISVIAGLRGLQTPAPAVCGSMKVQVGTSVDRLAESIGALLTPADRARRKPNMTFEISQDGQELQCTVTDADGSGEPVPFEACSIRTVEHLRAHRHILSLHGKVWSRVGQSRAYQVVLPLHP